VYEEKVVASDETTASIQDTTMDYAASKLKFGPELATDLLKRLQEILALRIEEYEEKGVVASDDKTTEVTKGKK
jgi:hypothetical protein